MIDEAPTSSESGKPDAQKQSLTPSAPTERLDSTKEKKDASKVREYGKTVVRHFLAIRSGIGFVARMGKEGFLLADTHSGGITAIATVAIVVLTIFYVHYSALQWKVMLATQRPWMGVDGNIKVAKPPSYSAQENQVNGYKFVRVEMELSYRLKNYGSTPARREEHFFDLASPAYLGVLTARQLSDNTCNSVAKTRESLPYTNLIFPGVVPVTTSVWAVIPLDTTRVKNMTITGCIVYQDSSGEVVYRTRMIYCSGSENDEINAPLEKVLDKPELWVKPITQFYLCDADTE